MGTESEKLVVVCRVQGEAKASIMKGRLESEGIPALLQYESLGSLYGVLADGLGEVRVLVPESLAKEAGQILEGQADEGRANGGA